MASLRPVRAVRIGSKNADSMKTFVVASEQPEFLAAHDAADALRPFVVGDDAHLGIECVGLAVEREQRLAVPGKSRVHLARELVGIEHVQGPSSVMRDEVADIDERGDGSEPDGLQPVLHPLRRRPVFHAAHIAAGEHRTRVRRGGREIERDGLRARESARHRFHRAVLQCADAAGREIASNAVNPRRIAAVRRERDIDDGIVESQRLRRRLADLGVGGQLDDPVVIVGEKKLAARTQHAARFHASDGGDPERLAGNRDDDARLREYGLHSRMCVWRTTDHLHDAADRFSGRGRSDLDHAELELVGIGMFLGRDDMGDGEILQPRAGILDRFHLQADLRKPRRDLGRGGGCVEMVLQPGEREFHRSPSNDNGE